MKKPTYLISLSAFLVILLLSCDTPMEPAQSSVLKQSESNSLMKKKKNKERIVHGIIDRSGIVSGSGFTVTVINPQDSNPKFVVTFDTPFNNKPTVALTLFVNSPRSSAVILPSDLSAAQFTAWANVGGIDEGILFIAIGPS